MMLSRHRHALLVNGLEQQAAPLGASAHFQLYPLTATPLADEFIIIHEFSASQIDNNLGYYVVSELLPLLAAHRRRVDSGYSEQDEFERSVGDIVRSMAGNERRAWWLFYANTLNATQNSAGLGQPPGRSDEAASDFISLFGAIYRYALELIEALPAAASPPTVLDAATCFGFFPLLLARVRAATLGEIAGCDLNPALMAFAADYASHDGLTSVQFGVADILTDDIERELAPLSARFDVVTALHLLEHLEFEHTEKAVANLWRLTARRLIIAVPLEETPNPRYGHRQVFDRERLLALGRTLGGPFEYFEHHGGWLVIDRPHATVRPAKLPLAV
ncbi:MAG: class I SAM-dependent methyltransferase [Candidatus Competibacter sp.]|nr:class I SAM-dependent methyltransferase [Candidatus Competibacter sp.]MDG4605688.1 class I SAM-dependent methyltransferase [Candidatus Contendobacter sp.]HRD48783.1 class I SAM-dependent methyltransferase [Candidatus Contendobacter sp.]